MARFELGGWFVVLLSSIGSLEAQIPLHDPNLQTASPEVLQELSDLLVAGFSNRSNSATRRRNGGFPCRAAASGGQTGKDKLLGLREARFRGVRVDFSHSAMSVLSPNVFETVPLIT